jgi:hypothetical protein
MSNIFLFFQVHRLGHPHKGRISGHHASFPKQIEDFREREVLAKELVPFPRKSIVVSDLNPNKISAA